MAFFFVCVCVCFGGRRGKRTITKSKNCNPMIHANVGVRLKYKSLKAANRVVLSSLLELTDEIGPKTMYLFIFASRP